MEWPYSVEESGLLPPNPHPLVAELLLFVALLQAAVLTVRILRGGSGRDAALQVVEMNVVAPILALVGVLFGMFILAFILFASRTGPSTLLELLMTAGMPETFTMSEVFANMSYVQRSIVFILMVAPTFLSLWTSTFKRLAAAFAAQLLLYPVFSRLADMQVSDLFTNLLQYNLPEVLAITTALTGVFFQDTPCHGSWEAL